TARMVHLAHVDRLVSLEELASEHRWAITMAVEWLATRMPDPMQVPPGVSTASKRAQAHLLSLNGKSVDPRARASRDKEIRRLAREGRGVQWIAANSNLS